MNNTQKLKELHKKEIELRIKKRYKLDNEKNKLDSEKNKFYNKIDKLYSKINKLDSERYKLYNEIDKFNSDIFGLLDMFEKENNCKVNWLNYDYDFKLKNLRIETQTR